MWPPQVMLGAKRMKKNPPQVMLGSKRMKMKKKKLPPQVMLGAKRMKMKKEKEEDGNFGLKRMTNKTNKNMPPQWLRLKWMKFNKLAKLRR